MANHESVMRVTVRVVHDAVGENYDSHNVDEIQEKFTSWISDPVLENNQETLVKFDGATFAEQIEREPTPVVRIALAGNDSPQPLIEGGYIRRCIPSPDWSLE